MTLRIGGFTSRLTEFFKERLDGNTENTGTSASLFDLVKSGETSSMSVDDLLSMEIKDGNFVKSNKTDEDGNDKSDLTSILNSYLKEEEVIKALDTDKSGNLSKNELTSFLNTIKGNDNNLEDISVSDIYEASKQIDGGKFEITEDTEIKEESETAENKETKEAEGAETTGSEESQSASNGGSNGGGGNGGVGGNGLGGNVNGSQFDLQAEGNYEGMPEPELKAKEADADKGLQEGQDALNAVLNGTNEAVAQAQQNIDNAYNSYQEELKVLNETMAKELDEIKRAADEKEQELNTKKMEVSEQNTKVSECKSNYESAVSTRQSLESTLSSLQSAAASADEEEKAAIEAQITSVEAQLEAAKVKEEETKIKLEEAKTKLETLKQQQTNLQTEKTNIDQQEMAKNQEIAMEYPQLAEKQTAYNEAKTAYDSIKASEENEANKLINHNQNIKNNIQAEFNRRENEDKEKENTSSIKGDYDEEEGLSLVETAKKMLAKYGSTTGWCATGVSRTMAMHYNIQMGGHGFQWDSNMDKLVDQGMFKEVTGDYRSSNELSNLPAGAVVCWEGTGGSEGGAKYGHVTIADGKGGEISDHYQKNIYKSVGGGTTQYRVYIPV